MADSAPPGAAGKGLPANIKANAAAAVAVAATASHYLMLLGGD
jgi:hypothetical protein